MSFAPLTFPGRCRSRSLPFVAALVFRLATPSTILAAPADPAGEVVRLKAAHMADETFAWHKGLERFRDAVRTRSGNTIEVQIFANGQLGTEKDYVQYLVQGVLDLATVAPSSASGLAREASFLDLMYLWRDQEHWQRALDGDLGRQLAEILERGTAKGGNPGLRVLGYWGGSELHVAARLRGYQTMKELAGIKLRTQDSTLQQEMWKLQGATPMVLPFQATLNALQNASLDGVDGSLMSFLNTRLFEAAPHISQTGHLISVRPLFISGHTWRKLSSVQQKAVLEAAREATSAARTLELQQAQDAEAQLKGKAVVRFYSFKEKQQMREQTLTVRQRVATEMGLQGLLDMVEEGWGDAKGSRKK